LGDGQMGRKRGAGVAVVQQREKGRGWGKGKKDGDDYVRRREKKRSFSGGIC